MGQPGTFTVSLTVTDPRSGSDTKTTVVTVGPPVDRAPPNVSLRVPAEVLPGTSVQLFAEAQDNVGVTSVAIDVAGAGAVMLTEAPYQRGFQVPGSAVPGTKIPVGATARDAAGNSGTAATSMTIVAAPDVTPPASRSRCPPRRHPAQGSCSAPQPRTTCAWRRSRSCEEPSPSPAMGCALRRPLHDPRRRAIGSVISFVARATDDAGNSAEDTRSLTVVALPDTTPPTVTLSAPARARPGDTIELVASAQDDRGVSDVAFTVDEVPVASVATPPYRTRYTVPPIRPAGTIVRARARATDTSGLTAAALADTRVAESSVGAALVFGAVYDDTTGLPLGNVDVAVTGEDGSGAAFARRRVRRERPLRGGRAQRRGAAPLRPRRLHRVERRLRWSPAWPTAPSMHGSPHRRPRPPTSRPQPAAR